jgi:uncharacterized protein YjbI with pentapeptide repeats
MIVKTLPEIEDADQINQAAIYEAYIDTLLERRWSNETDYISPKDRRFFMQELAWEMYTNQRLTIPFSEFPERVMKHFGFEDDPERAAFFERDVRTQSYLVRDDEGNYRFAHKSFQEYFVARQLCDDLRKKRYWRWSIMPLSIEVESFLVDMVTDLAALWTAIWRTRGSRFVKTRYTGSNAATLLNRVGTSFAGKNLTGVVLRGADLCQANMIETLISKSDLALCKLRKALLTAADLNSCSLEDADLSGADLETADLGKANLRRANLCGSSLEPCF